jgi:hypothetical protein
MDFTIFPLATTLCRLFVTLVTSASLLSMSISKKKDLSRGLVALTFVRKEEEEEED